MTYRVSPRARHVRLTVHRDRRVVVTVPRRCSIELAERFVREREEWIRAALARLPVMVDRLSKLEQKRLYQEKKGEALERVRSRVASYANLYGLTYRSIRIKNTKSRWGSCSRQKNLSFNYHLLELNDEQLDYLVVHEVCHLQEMNHSIRFWRLVEQTIPDYKKRRIEIRKIGRQLL